MQDLTVTLMQSKLAWEQPSVNRAHFDELLAAMGRQTDLVVLPEMFTTGFTMNAAPLAETMDGPTQEWLRLRAQKYGCALTGSVIIEENGRYFNRLFFALPDGALHWYDKRHLFRMAGEEKVYSAGDRRLVVEMKGWRICPFVCYDLRFPVWMRNTPDLNYDLIVIVANWPAKRAAHWNALLPARAIENQSWLAAVNRVGADGHGYDHAGDSAVYDPLGRELWRRTNAEAVASITLSHELLQTYRRDFPVWKDADRFELDQ